MATESLPLVRFSSFSARANRKIYQDLRTQLDRDKAYIEALEQLLQESNVPVPEEILSIKSGIAVRESIVEDISLMKDGTYESLQRSLTGFRSFIDQSTVAIHFRELSFWNMVTEDRIPTVGTALKNLIFPGKKQRVDVLKDLTGRLAPQKMTLIMGPPGCGKSTFLKAMCGQLNVGKATLEGEITYNGARPDSGKFLIGKIADYVDEKDQHAATLTVEETLEFAWLMSNGGHHSYGVRTSEEGKKKLDSHDEERLKVMNVLKVLGIFEVRGTVVGDGALRGVSGGQKRRVTLGEMLMPNRKAKFMDAVSNGLDSQTTYDIMHASKLVCELMGQTNVISLLQPSPEVFNLFDELILFNEGQIIYHGPREKVLGYFTSLGYDCPATMDVADWLQELPTPEGRRFIRNKSSTKLATDAFAEEDAKGRGSGGMGEAAPIERMLSSSSVPRGTTQLVEAWKNSELYKSMLAEMELEDEENKNKDWPTFLTERYASTFWFSLKHCLERQVKLTIRDTTFVKGRIMQSVIVATISGTLFSNLATEDVTTMSGIIFFASLSNALSAMALLPVMFAQREVFYKHSRAHFYHTPAFVVSQTLVLYPLQMLEILIFSLIVYWSVGLSDDDNGARFFIFYIVIFVFSLTAGQIFRFISTFLDSPVTAQPFGGVIVVLMVLFSGYIIPKVNIPPGWEWFYYLNPLAYALQALMINELTAEDYDFPACSNPPACTQQDAFGIVNLEGRGFETDRAWIWWGVLVMLAEYFALIGASAVMLSYLRVEATPPPPVFVDEAAMLAADEAANAVAESVGSTKGRGSMKAAATAAEVAAAGGGGVEIPFEPVAFAFKDVWYTVTLPSGEELDLLKGVSGFFEPGTVTALMGSSGAGKTTLLDVLSGRKNTGNITGLMTVNGRKKEEHSFRRIMGYVEQFDSLAPHDTAREAIEFSAALRLPRTTSAHMRAMWVDSVLSMLELGPLENTMVGSQETGGMSFEQKKRVSIGVELAANPAILYLDEPTSGLDSRSAQVVIRCIRRVASSGRSVVCTIHQPSSVIFDAFDSLLLLRRGGQTVFFGELGEHATHLVHYFEGVPGVNPMPPRQNAATWMLEVIGAGTTASSSTVDFHEHYKQSALCSANTTHVDALTAYADIRGSYDNHDNNDTSGNEGADDEEGGAAGGGGVQLGRVKSMGNPLKPVMLERADTQVVVQQQAEAVKYKYNAPYLTQFKLLMYRFHLAFWRSPSYNFVRMLVSVIIALIFASTYADQTYTSSIDVTSRCAVIYITVLFCGVVAMMSVQPVMFGERPAFYREKFSELYDVKLYVLAATLVEIPYLIVSSVLFVIPFFYIVGFDKGDEAVKFAWYWLFQGLYMSTLVFLGHFLAAATPAPPVAAVVGGLSSTLISLFSGFMITEADMPAFWTFVYWLCPLHYANEGLFMTQFYKDSTPITLLSGQPSTAEAYVESFFSTWDYSHRHLDYTALILMIIALRFGTYMFLENVRHDKR